MHSLFTILNASSRIGGSPKPLDFTLPEQLADLIVDVAHDVLDLDLSTIPDAGDKILAVSLAAARLATNVRSALPTDINPFDLAQDGSLSVDNSFSQGEWLSTIQTLADTQQVGLWLAGQSASLAAGGVDVVQYMDATSTAALYGQADNSSLSVSISIGCLDPSSATFSYSATLHAESECLVTGDSFVYAFLSMSAADWIYFIITVIANAWLITSWLCSARFQARVSGLKAMAETQLPSYPSVSVFIPCYMPNEQVIIMETLEAMTKSEYDGELSFYVVYNTPVDLLIEAELAKLTSMNGRKVKCARVPNSKSKAANLEFGLSRFTKGVEFCVLFDADHHPRPHTIRGLVTLLAQREDIVSVQGAVLIERGGYWPVRRILDGMEWASWSMYSPGFGELVGSAYFGGGNAAWRVKTIKSLGFDHNLLTEDIDISIRAMASGYKLQFAPWLQVGEMCPSTFKALYKQRLRWAMGWEQVTMERMYMLFASSNISEPKKWRCVRSATSAQQGALLKITRAGLL